MNTDAQVNLLHDDDDSPIGEYVYRPTTRQRRFTEPTDAYEAIQHQDAQRAHNHKEN